MKRKLSFAVLAALGAFALVLLSGVPLPYPAHAQASPSVAVSLSSASVEEGSAITVTMSFSGLESDSDTATRDYVFRADVMGADECEDRANGYGLGVDRSMWQVDEDPEVRTGSVSADCPAGDYTVRASISSPDSVELASARASFTVTAPTPEQTPLVAIALFPSSSVEQGTAIAVTMGFIGLQSDWDTGTTDYIFRADVVDADACEGDGLGVDRYMYQVDEDPETRTGAISADCPAGDYALEASISSSDGVKLASARASFRVTEPEEGEADPPDSVQQQTAPVDITLDSQNKSPRGVWSDGTTVWVVDNQRHKLYAYTLSSGARDSGKDITLDGANRNPTGAWSDGTTIWVADDSDYKLYAYTLSGGARDSGKEFGLASRSSGGTFAADDNTRPVGVWSNGTTIWVADNTDDKLYAYTLSNGSRDTAKEFSIRQGAETPAGVWADGTTMWVVYQGFNKALAYTISGGSRDAGLDLSLRISSNNWGAWSDGTTMWVGNSGTGTQKLFHHPLPETDATLSDLSVSGFTLSPAFAAHTTHYTASVAHSVASTTVTATTNDAAATVLITPADADASAEGRQVSLNVGSNTITVKVTAKNGTTTRTYTMTVTRATSAASIDASLSTLALSHPTSDAVFALSPSFDAAVTSYMASRVYHEHTKILVTATANHASATVVIARADSGSDEVGAQLPLRPGYNTITVTVTAEDGATTRTYTLEVMRDWEWSQTCPSPLVEEGDSVTVSLRYGPLAGSSVVGTVSALYASDSAQIGTDFIGGPASFSIVGGTTASVTIQTIEDEVAEPLERFSVTMANGVASPSRCWFTIRDDDFDFPTAPPEAEAIWGDGTNLWVSSDYSDHLVSFDSSGQQVDDLDFAVTDTPTGLWGDDVRVYVVNSGEKKVSAFDRSSMVADSSWDIDTLEAAGNDEPKGIAGDGETLWVSDSEDDRLYAYVASGLARGARDPGKDFRLAAENDAPHGLWTDNVIMWVADSTDGKAYAYKMSDRSRDPANDLQFPFTDLHGIWSDGRDMWGVNKAGSAVHKLDMPGPPSSDIRPAQRQRRSLRHLVRRDHHLGGRLQRRKALRLHPGRRDAPGRAGTSTCTAATPIPGASGPTGPPSG